MSLLNNMGIVYALLGAAIAHWVLVLPVRQQQGLFLKTRVSLPRYWLFSFFRVHRVFTVCWLDLLHYQKSAFLAAALPMFP